jgi:hypothetical protein
VYSVDDALQNIFIFRQIHELPPKGRSYARLAALSPGITQIPQKRIKPGFSQA